MDDTFIVIITVGIQLLLVVAETPQTPTEGSWSHTKNHRDLGLSMWGPGPVAQSGSQWDGVGGSQ